MYKFKPLLKQTLWGGDRIKAFKQLDTTMDCVGESWELSGVEGSETVVAEGPQQGLTLNQLVSLMRHDLVGHQAYQRFGNIFPLLVKFIDARRDLSIQVHPDDDTARRMGYERGKTEMWYVLDAADSRSSLFCGLKQHITPAQYRQMVENDSITEALASYQVHPGDVFYIPAGRIHAIGAGCFIAEIQQTSDVTFRIYDYHRRDAKGQLRQLHTGQAAQSIDYSVAPDYRTPYVPAQNQPVRLVSCQHFTTTLYDLTRPMQLDYAALDSFVVVIVLAGQGTFSTAGQSATLHQGETLLLPATTRHLSVEGTVKFLTTHV